MKKIIFALIIGLLIIPNMAGAKDLQKYFKYQEVLEPINESIVAGSSVHTKMYFFYEGKKSLPLVVMVNVTSSDPDFPVGKDDFNMSAVFKSDGIYEENMKCVSRLSDISSDEKEYTPLPDYIKSQIYEIPDGIWYCFAKDNLLLIYPQFTQNWLAVYITSNPALYPANYTFNVGLWGIFGVPKIEPHAVTNENGTAEIPLGNITTVKIKTNKAGVEFRATLYTSLFISPSTPNENLIPLYYIEIENNDSSIGPTRLEIPYSDIGSLEPHNLKIYRFDLDSYTWLLINSTVNTTGHYIWADIDHFSLFGIFGREAYCGDGYCNNDENSDNCPQDCPKPPSPSPPGGGFLVLPPCTEDWSCTGWSECFPEGIQTRTCTDLNECGTEEDMPEEIRTCEIEGVAMCVEGLRVCAGNMVVECFNGTTWEKVESCEWGCEDGACQPEPEPGKVIEEGTAGLVGLITESPVALWGIIFLIIIILAGGIYWKARR